ncbi:hypothetical protein QE152_g9129 [Popillia japonica]|uniref:Peptidase S1 domain-containing protein n=1 Tax=Popillia japonica TaxID=7064 RepID=A0AAW1LZG0_POPJA
MNALVVSSILLLPTLVNGCAQLVKKDPRDFYVGIGNWSDKRERVYCTGAILATSKTYTVLTVKQCFDALHLPVHRIKLMRWNPSNGALIKAAVIEIMIIDNYFAIKPKPGFIQRYENIFLNRDYDPDGCTVVHPQLPIGDSVNLKTSIVKPVTTQECKKYVNYDYWEEVRAERIKCFVPRYSGRLCSLNIGYLLACNQNKELGGVGFLKDAQACYVVVPVWNTKYLNTSSLPGVTVVSSLSTIRLSKIVVIFITLSNLLTYLYLIIPEY